jgi:hypothetical protein
MNSYRAILLFVAAQLVACGPSQVPKIEHVSKVGKQIVNFEYVLHGRTYQLSDLRGTPLTLVLMRTSDIPSQVYMAQVKEAFRAIAGKTTFLVLTIEPAESPFVELYVESEELPFPIGIASENVQTGHSPLGKIPVVPTTYFIDATGKLKRSLPGVVDAKEIVQAALRLKKS